MGRMQYAGQVAGQVSLKVASVARLPIQRQLPRSPGNQVCPLHARGDLEAGGAGDGEAQREHGAPQAKSAASGAAAKGNKRTLIGALRRSIGRKGTRAADGAESGNCKEEEDDVFIYVEHSCLGRGDSQAQKVLGQRKMEEEHQVRARTEAWRLPVAAAAVAAATALAALVRAPTRISRTAWELLRLGPRSCNGIPLP